MKIAERMKTVRRMPLADLLREKADLEATLRGLTVMISEAKVRRMRVKQRYKDILRLLKEKDHREDTPRG